MVDEKRQQEQKQQEDISLKDTAGITGPPPSATEQRDPLGILAALSEIRDVAERPDLDKFSIWDNPKDGKLARDQRLEDSLDTRFIGTNALFELAEIVKIPFTLVQAMAPSAIEIGGNLDWLTKIDWWNVGEDFVDGLVGVGKAVIDSFQKWEDPGRAIHNHPLESALDIFTAVSILGSLTKTAARGAGKAGLRTAVGSKEAAILRNLEKRTQNLFPATQAVRNARTTKFKRAALAPEIKLAQPLSKILQRKIAQEQVLRRAGGLRGVEPRFQSVINRPEFLSGELDFVRLGELMEKLPTKLFRQTLERGIPVLREKFPLLGAAIAGSGFGRLAREVGKLDSTRRKNISALRQEAGAISLRPIGKLKLSKKESQLGLFQLSGLRGVWDKRAEIARLASAGDRGAVQLQRLVPAIEKEYGDMLKLIKELPKERLTAISRAVDHIRAEAKREIRLFKAVGAENPEQFQKAQIRNIMNELGEDARFARIQDQVVGVEGVKDVKALLRKRAAERKAGVIPAASTDDILETLSKLEIQPDYIPIAEVLNRSTLERALERLTGTSLKGARLNRFEQAEKIRLKELFEKVDDKGRPLFKTELDEIALHMSTSSAIIVENLRFLKQIEALPESRLLTPETLLTYNSKTELLFVPGIYSKYTRDLDSVSKLVFEEMKRLKIKNFSADALKRVWPGIKDQVVRVGIDGVEELMAKQLRVYAVPNELGIAVRRSLTPPAALAELVFDTPLNIWKSTVLLYNPGWYIQNILGNIMLAWMARTDLLIAPYLPARRHLMRRIEDILPDELSINLQDEARRVATTIELKNRPVAGFLANLPVIKQVRALTNSLARMNNAVEGMMRKQIFVGFFEKRFNNMKKSQNSLVKSFSSIEDVLRIRTVSQKQGIEAVEELVRKSRGKISREQIERLVSDADKLTVAAIDDVNRALFDYFNLAPFERQFMRRVFPFWTWLRNTNILAFNSLKNGFDQPLKFLALQRLSKIGGDLLRDQDFPQRLKQSMLIGATEDGAHIFLDFRRYNLFYSVGEQALEFANTNPIIKIFIERITGINTFTERPFNNGELVFFHNGKIARYSTETGKFTLTASAPPLVTHILKQFPQHNWLSNMIHPFVQTDKGNIFAPDPIRNILGDPRFEREFLFSFVQAMGVPFLKLTNEQLRDLRSRKLSFNRKTITDLKNMMGRLPPEQRELAFEALLDLNSDHRAWLNFER